MEKNWLIRTKSNHILGPISKEKVIELYQNGSIKPDDEVCSGNGYWFFIRELDLVEKFLTGSEVQGFNPISEAKDVLQLTASEKQTHETPREHVTQVEGLNISILRNNPEPEKKVSAEDTIKKKVNPKVRSKSSNKSMEKLKKQDYLKYLGFLGFALLLLMIYFRNYIRKSIFNGEVTLRFPIGLIETASAQPDEQSKKKAR